MVILQLKYFEKIATYENISQAAKDLHISQSALSNSLNRLETELGVPLFTRMGKKLILNDAGNQFLKATRQIMFLLSNNHLITKTSINLAGSLSIMIGQTDLSFFQCMNAYRAVSPESSFRLYLDSQCLDTILPSQDFLLSTRYHPFFKDMHCSIRIASRELFVVLPKSHPLAQRASVPLSLLSKEKFVFHNYPDGSWERAYYLCIKSGFVPSVAYTVDQPFMKVYFLIQEAAVGFVNNDLKLYFEPYQDELSILPVDRQKETPLFLSWKEDIPLSATALDFLAFAKEYYHI